MGITVPYEIRTSPIHGKGVFATERIPKGTIVWIYTAETNKLMTVDQFRKALEDPNTTDQERHDLCWHGFGYMGDPNYGDLWLVPTDGNEFTNHSKTPNITWPDGINDLTAERSVAARDIEIGEEMVEDYSGYGMTEEVMVLLRKYCPERAAFEEACRK